MHADPEKLAGLMKAEIDVPWDDVRAARVQKSALEAFRAAKEQDDAAQEQALSELEAKLEKPGTAKRWRVLSAAAAVILAAAMTILWLQTNDTTTPASSWAVASLDYNDGSRSLMADNAQVQVVHDTSERVRVKQRAGKVRYEITKRPERRFVIGAHDVVITVLGTVFDVDVAERSVSVVVERGRVRVDHGDDSSIVLTAGQRVTIATGGEQPEPQAAVSDDQKADPAQDAEQDGAVPSPQGDAVKHEAVVVGGGAPAPPSAQDLLRQADQARASGNLGAAVGKLQTLIRLHPRDPRVTVATFTLARIYRQQGDHAAAARSFEACGSGLRGDAIAEAAVSWLAAGDAARGRAAAQRYLDAFPQGVHTDRMRNLVGGQ